MVSCGSSNPAMGRTVLVLFLGQALSFSVAITNFSLSLVAKQGVDAPLSISFFSYLSMTVVYGAVMLFRGQKLSVPWYWYVFLGMADAQGNYLVMKAYNYTSITSVTVLLCCSIAWAIVFTRLFLGTKYSLWQFLGAGICVGGLCIVLIADSKPDLRGSYSPLFGDMLVILGTVFLTLGNVGLEFYVKKKDRVEAMTMMGFFGTIITILGVFVFERDTVEAINWTHRLVLLYIGVVVPNIAFFTIGPILLKMSGATLFNLSILTSNMWVVLIRLLLYKEQLKWLLYPAYALVIIGIVIYSKAEENPGSSEAVVDGNITQDYTLLVEENGKVDVLK